MFILWKSAIILIALVSSVAVSPTYTTAPTKQVVDPVLQKIGYCESRNRQFDESGEVLRGKLNPEDIGKYQINLKYHQEEAQRLGYDLFSEIGNEGYAIYLFEKEGTKPWNWSKNCWN